MINQDRYYLILGWIYIVELTKPLKDMLIAEEWLMMKLREHILIMITHVLQDMFQHKKDCIMEIKLIIILQQELFFQNQKVLLVILVIRLQHFSLVHNFNHHLWVQNQDLFIDQMEVQDLQIQVCQLLHNMNQLNTVLLTP